MKKLCDYLLVGIFVLTALLFAVVGLKAYSGYREEMAQQEEEIRQYREAILARNAEAQNRVMEMETEIADMIEDREALQVFIDEMVAAANEVQYRKEQEQLASEEGAAGDEEVIADNVLSEDGEMVSDNELYSDEETISGNGLYSDEGTISGNGLYSDEETISGNGLYSDEETISGNGLYSDEETISGNGLYSDEGTISGNQFYSDEETISGNQLYSDKETVSGNHSFGHLVGDVSENGQVNYYDGNMTDSDVFDEWRYIYEQADMSLEERKELRTSYQETLEVNQADREWIAENQYDFSGMKIACLGDSITAAANLEGEENYEQYAYPARIQELLGAEEVYNLGIGGSSIGRYWADAFVERYMEIPGDSDIIIVLGGTNDGFCVSDEEFGSLEERKEHTFCGDLDELMGGLRENYPDATIFFATPLPNVLQDYLMSERDYLLPQKDFVEVIKTLAQEYDYEVIDLYNSNILDSHDANVIAEYIPDGVHGNPDGYQILAEHFASEIVKYYADDEEADRKEKENGDSGSQFGEEGAAGMDGDEDSGIDSDADADADYDLDSDMNAGEDSDMDGNTDTDADSGLDSDMDTGESPDMDGGPGTDGDRDADTYDNGAGTDPDRGRRRYEY